jgi:hypothetical protein
MARSTHLSACAPASDVGSLNHVTRQKLGAAIEYQRDPPHSRGSRERITSCLSQRPLLYAENTMPRGDKSSYTNKQKRQAEHIEEGYKQRGLSSREAERRAWATVNKETGGGKKSGSGRGKKTNRSASRRGGRIGSRSRRRTRTRSTSRSTSSQSRSSSRGARRRSSSKSPRSRRSARR